MNPKQSKGDHMGSTITSMSDDTSQTTTVDELSETMRSYASELRDLKDDLEAGKADRLDALARKLEGQAIRLENPKATIVVATVELTEEKVDELTFRPIVDRRENGTSGRSMTSEEAERKLTDEFPFLRDA